MLSFHTSLKQWFPKCSGAADPLGDECRGSAIVQPNIGGPYTFKKKESRIIEFSLRIGAYY